MSALARWVCSSGPDGILAGAHGKRNITGRRAVRPTHCRVGAAAFASGVTTHGGVGRWFSKGTGNLDSPSRVRSSRDSPLADVSSRDRGYGVGVAPVSSGVAMAIVIGVATVIGVAIGVAACIAVISIVGSATTPQA